MKSLLNERLDIDLLFDWLNNVSLCEPNQETQMKIAHFVSEYLTQERVEESILREEIKSLSLSMLSPIQPLELTVDDLQKNLKECEKSLHKKRAERDETIIKNEEVLKELSEEEEELLKRLSVVQGKIQAHLTKSTEYTRQSGLKLKSIDLKVKLLERGISEKRNAISNGIRAQDCFEEFCNSLDEDTIVLDDNNDLDGLY